MLPISERHHAYANALASKLEEAGLRVECDLRAEKIGYKIREAQVQQTPYMLVVGDKEIESASISVRHRKEGDLGAMDAQAFIDMALNEIKTREIK